jgi:phosphohistidine phosphatase
MQQAERMGAWLKSVLRGEPGSIVVSPAMRARQTAQAYSDAYHVNPAIGTAAVPEDILRVVAWPYGNQVVLVVGHQPTLGAAAALALTARQGLFAIPPGSIWWLSRGENSRETLLRAVMTAELAPGAA